MRRATDDQGAGSDCVKRLVIVFGLICSLAASSCGDGDEPSKADFIAQADAICKRLNARYSVLVDEINRNVDLPATPTNDEALGALEEQSAEVIGEEVRQLRTLTPPDGDEATIHRLLDALSEFQDLTVEVAHADSASDFRTSNTLQDHADDVQRRTQGIGAGYGFKECPYAPSVAIRSATSS
jgi:hypothetical protein